MALIYRSNEQSPDFSILTACYNSETTIAETIESVRDQRNVTFEHIIVDGHSSDSTLDVVRRHLHSRLTLLTEPDSGIYDALNKGVRLARGRYIAVLQADDYYNGPSVLGMVHRCIGLSQALAVYADLDIVRHEDTSKVVRRWRAGRHSSADMATGWMPPHPTLFLSAKLHEDYGAYDKSYRISGDYEMMLRVLYSHRTGLEYLPRTIVNMRAGGASSGSFRQQMQKWREDMRAMRTNGIRSPSSCLGLKLLRKLPQIVPSVL